jgi:hypothetical protein
MLKPVLNCVFVFISLLFSSCSGDDILVENAGEETQSDFFYQDLELPVLVQQKQAWGGNKSLTTNAKIKKMKLHFSLAINDIPASLMPVSISKNDTFPSAIFNIELLNNNQKTEVALNPQKHSWLYRNGIRESSKTIDFTSDLLTLNRDRYIEITVPLFALSKFPANKQIALDLHVWQDYFLSEEKHRTVVEQGEEHVVYYRDTLKTKLIDNVYTLHLTIPSIYKSEIICDSIVLQNDKDWSPYGSDNTLWKSTLPDIYFAIHDLYCLIQGSSTVEKSTDKFTVGDTVPYYHYREQEQFYIYVNDYDALSNDDVLGAYKDDISAFENSKTYCLNFGHIRKFYFRKKYYGRIN